jgi:hypothetical protein
MHLIVPFAGPLGEAGRAALRGLALPQLRALLSRAAEVARDAGDEWSFSPPHERALARALGWSGGDGCLPWAARWAAADGVPEAAQGDLAWGLVSPVHWHLGTDQVSLIDPATLMLDDATSRVLFDAVLPLFTSEGFVMAFGSATRWYIAHETLAPLRCASLDRVIGRNVDGWLTEDPAVRLVRRLQNEVQMLLYTHPLNDRREAHGLLPVNSFWLSGCGVAQAVTGAAPRVDERLRGPALADDWAAWVKAWDTLDEGPIAELRVALERGAPARLTLCGERSSVSFDAANGFAARVRARWSRPSPLALLESL